jgi:hypothetical protein
MISTLLHLVRLLPFLCGGHRYLALENLALRQQLAVYKRTGTLTEAARERSCPSPKPHPADIATIQGAELAARR